MWNGINAYPAQVLVEDYTDKMRAKLGLQSYDARLSTELMKLMWVLMSRFHKLQMLVHEMLSVKQLIMALALLRTVYASNIDPCG